MSTASQAIDARPAAAPLEVTRHESELGWWELCARGATPVLRQHVLGYCGYAEETRAFTRRRELPSGEVVLIVGLGPSLETVYPDRSPDRPETHRSFVAGLHETHCVVGSPGSQCGVQVNLTPLGAHRLLGVPMHELTDRVVELDDLLGGEAGEIAERLHDAADWEARFALLDAALGRRLEATATASPDVAWAWGTLVETGGRVSVEDLCRELRCSRRHIARRFREQVGVSPKAYARVLRFQRAVRMIGHTDGAAAVGAGQPGAARGMGWAEVARTCGYFDQAHMNRDFREFAGASPGELAATLLPEAGGLAA